MEKNNENNDKQSVSKATAHQGGNQDAVFATASVIPPPLLITADAKHSRQQVKKEEQVDEQIDSAEIVAENETNATQLKAEVQNNDLTIPVQAKSSVKEEEPEEEMKESSNIELVFADAAPDEDGENEGSGEDDGGNSGNEENPFQKKKGQGNYEGQAFQLKSQADSIQTNKLESSPTTHLSVVQKQDSNLDLLERGGHPRRNQHNQFPVGLLTPADESSNPNFEYREDSTEFLDETGQVWIMKPDSDNVYHQPPDVVDGFLDNMGQNISSWWNDTERDPFPNKKFLSPDGDTGGSFEAILQPDEGGGYSNNWLNEGTQQGSYNFYSPEGAAGNAGHFLFDILPHFVNDDYDDTPVQEKKEESPKNATSRQLKLEEEEEIQMKIDPLQLMIGDEKNEEEEIQLKSHSSSDGMKGQKNIGIINTAFQLKVKDEEEEIQLKEKSNIDLETTEAPAQLKAADIIPSGVIVHTESSKATEVGALAYAQGSDIHFAPGQFKPDTRAGQELIGHELHHVVQQKQGRVQPTMQMKGINVNDDKGLEKEADDFGVKFADSLQAKNNPVAQNKLGSGFSLGNPPMQKKENSAVDAPLQLKPEASAGGSGAAGGGASEGTGPISIEGSQTVAKGLLSSQPLPLFEKIKTAPASLSAALSSESTELNGSFPNIEQPTGVKNQPLADGAETTGPQVLPTHLGYAGQGGAGDVTVPAEPINRGPNTDIAQAMPPSPVPTANVASPPSTNVSIGDENVDFSAGTRPEVDTSGEADPAKMTTQETQDTAEVESDKTTADLEINNDHGEEDIFPHYAELENLTPDVEIPQGQEIAVPQFEELAGKSAEIDAGFNAQAQGKLDQDMAQHVAGNEAEVQKMNQGSEEEWTTYETSKTEEEARVKTEQETAQKTAKTEVTTQQENWKTENEDVKKQFVKDAAAAKTDYQGQIDGEITSADTDVKNTFNQAEIDAAKEAEDAQRQADEKQAESDNDDGGVVDWFVEQVSKGLDWLKDQFNKIIDVLKKAVEAIIEVAKTVASTIIDAARRAITSLITAFGELLKTFVDIAFAAFPGIRDRIKDVIDTAVETAVEVVNTLADALKDFVNALLDVLGAALTFLLDTYQKFINILFAAIELLTVGLYKLYKGLTNLALSVKQSPGHFMGQLQEEFLGMNLSDKLPFERDAHPPASYFRPPVEGESMPSIDGMPPVLEKAPLSESDFDVAVINEPAGPELSQDLLENFPEGEQEFGGTGVDEIDLLRQGYAGADSGEGQMPDDAVPMTEAETYPYAHLADDPNSRADAELDTFLGNQPAPEGASASKDSGGAKADSSAVDDSMKIGPFTSGQRFRYLRTQMWNGIKGWFSANKVAIIAGIVAAVVIGIALVIASGGAVLSLIPPLMTVLGAFFLGEALVKAGVYLKNFLTKAWGGGAGLADGAKDFARAMVIMVVELIFILLFDLNTVIKAAKAGLKASIKSAVQGAKNTTKALVKAGRETVENTAESLVKVGKGALNIAQGGTKIVSEGLSSGWSKGVKTVSGLMDRVKNLKFKKFKLVRSGKWFKLYGKVNPWVLLATGSIEFVEQADIVKKSGDDSAARVGNMVEVDGIDGVIVGSHRSPSRFVQNLQDGGSVGDDLAGTFNNLSDKADDLARKSDIQSTPAVDWDALAREIGENPAKAIKQAKDGKLASNLPNKPVGENFQAHHMIPVETVGKSELLRQAIDGGFEFNAEVNGRWLKRFSSKTDELADGLHASHPTYNAEILERLNAAQLKLSRNGNRAITPEMARREVDKIAAELGRLLDTNSGLSNPVKIDDLFKS